MSTNPKTVFFLCSFMIVASFLNAQTKEVDQARGFITEYQKTAKESDLENAYLAITDAMKVEKNKAHDVALYLDAYITKLYSDYKKITPKSNWILRAFGSASKVLEVNPKFIDKEQTLQLTTYLCFDMYHEGIALFDQKKYEEAYQLYKKLLEGKNYLLSQKREIEVTNKSGVHSKLSSAEIMNNLAVFCINSGKKEEAKSILTNEVQSNPTAAKYSQLIQLQGQLGDYQAREDAIKIAREKYPQDYDLLITEVNYHIEKKNHKEAIKLLDQAISINKSNHELYLVKGQILSEILDMKGEVSIYREALSIAPNNYDVNYNLARALFNEGISIYNQHSEKSKPEALKMIEESRILFEKAKSIDPNRTDINKILDQIKAIK